MIGSKPPEAWLAGPVGGVAPLLQPVAHALLNAAQQIRPAIAGLSPVQLTSRPGDVGSIAFHVRHAMGSLDRLFTYARGESLSEVQRQSLSVEKNDDIAVTDAAELADAFDRSVATALGHLRTTDEATLLEHRGVGRAQLPSTVLGLLFHGGEHTVRHAGQIVTTAKLVRGRLG